MRKGQQKLVLQKENIHKNSEHIIPRTPLQACCCLTLTGVEGPTLC